MKEEEKNENENGKKKFANIQITELFMAKCGKKGWDRCFYGAIYREKDETGKEIAVNGNILIPGDGMLWSRDTDRDKYGENIDSIVELRLEYGLHKDQGVKSKIASGDFFHN